MERNIMSHIRYLKSLLLLSDAELEAMNTNQIEYKSAGELRHNIALSLLHLRQSLESELELMFDLMREVA